MCDPRTLLLVQFGVHFTMAAKRAISPDAYVTHKLKNSDVAYDEFMFSYILIVIFVVRVGRSNEREERAHDNEILCESKNSVHVTAFCAPFLFSLSPARSPGKRIRHHTIDRRRTLRSFRRRNESFLLFLYFCVRKCCWYVRVACTTYTLHSQNHFPCHT